MFEKSIELLSKTFRNWYRKIAEQTIRPKPGKEALEKINIDYLISEIESFRNRTAKLMMNLYKFKSKENDFIKKYFQNRYVSTEDSMTLEAFQWGSVNVSNSIKLLVRNTTELFAQSKAVRVIFKDCDLFFERTIFVLPPESLGGSIRVVQLKSNRIVEEANELLRNIVQKESSSLFPSSTGFLQNHETRKTRILKRLNVSALTGTVIQRQANLIIQKTELSEVVAGDNEFNFIALNLPERLLKDFFYTLLVNQNQKIAALINSQFNAFKAQVNNADFLLFLGYSNKATCSEHHDNITAFNFMLEQGKEPSDFYRKSTVNNRNDLPGPSKVVIKNSKDFMRPIRLSIDHDSCKRPSISQTQKTDLNFRIVTQNKSDELSTAFMKNKGLCVVAFRGEVLNIICLMVQFQHTYIKVLKKAIDLLMAKFPEIPIQIKFNDDRSLNFESIRREMHTSNFYVREVLFDGFKISHVFRSWDPQKHPLNPQIRNDFPTSQKLLMKYELDNPVSNLKFATGSEVTQGNPKRSFNYSSENSAQTHFSRPSGLHSFKKKTSEQTLRPSIELPNKSENEIFQSHKQSIGLNISGNQKVPSKKYEFFRSQTSSISNTKMPQCHSLRLRAKWKLVQSKDSNIKVKSNQKGSSLILVDIELLNFLSLSLIENQVDELKQSANPVWSRFSDRLVHSQYPLQRISFKNLSQDFYDLRRPKNSQLFEKLKKSLNKKFEVSLRDLLVVSGSLSQDLYLNHAFPVMIAGRKFLRISPGKHLYSFVGMKYDFDLFVIATKQPETSLFILQSPTFSEDVEIQDGLEFSIMISDFFKDINFTSGKRHKNAVYMPPFKISCIDYKDGPLLKNLEMAANFHNDNLQDKRSKELSLGLEWPIKNREPQKLIYSRLNQTFYRNGEPQEQESSKSIVELYSISDSMTQLQDESHRPSRSPNVKVEKQQADINHSQDAQGSSRMFRFKLDAEIEGDAVSNGLIYSPGPGDTVIRNRFVFGVLHRDVETLFLHPTVSFLVEIDRLPRGR